MFYKYIWTPFVGEILCVEQEACNPDHFAVAIVKVETIVCHLPCEVSHHVWYFIQHDRIVSCEVTGHRKHSICLEEPCTNNFSAKKNIKILHTKLEKLNALNCSWKISSGK